MERTRTTYNSSVVTLDQVPAWSDLEVFPTPPSFEIGLLGGGAFADPLLSPSSLPSCSKFPCDPILNSKLFVWHGDPWVLLIDAIVHTSNETLNIKESSPGLYSAAGPRLAEECAGLGGCRTGMAHITGAYDLPARRVIHTVGPKYVEKYHTAAENALSRCYQSCFELLIEHGLQSLAVGCIYEESKGYPREEAAHVALRTLRCFLEKHNDKVSAVVLCLSAVSDFDIYEKYRGGVDYEGHRVMVVVGAHFLLRCLDLEQFLLYVVKEFEPLIKESYSIVYFHSAAALNFVPDSRWMKRIHHIMGPRHKANLHRIYMVHPTLGLKASVMLLRLLADSKVWAKVAYVDSLMELFRYVPQDQLTIPDFVSQHDMDLHGRSQ